VPNRQPSLLNPSTALQVAALAASFLLPAPSGGAAPEPQPLTQFLRPTYLLPSMFSPAELRFPLRVDVVGELRAARSELRKEPDSLDARWKVAQLAEAAEDPRGDEAWQAVLEAAELSLKKLPDDPLLLERRAEALVRAGDYEAAVPAATALVAGRSEEWRVHVLLGDAHLLRADFGWRTLVPFAAAKMPLPPEAVRTMNADLAAAGAAYRRAAEQAPTEGAPRGARIALELARPLMAAFLPKGVLAGSEDADSGAIDQDLFELTLRNPGKVAPLWHAAHFFAAPPVAGFRATGVELGFVRQRLESLPAAGPEARFRAEALGMLAIAAGDWPEARKQMRNAAEATPRRALAVEWLHYAEAHARQEPIGERNPALQRLRTQAQGGPHSPPAWTALGLFLLDEDRNQALAAFRKASELDPSHAASRYNLALLLLQQDPESEEARHHLETLTEAAPDDREVLFAQLVVRALDGDTLGAESALRETLRRRELEPELRTRAEALLKRLGERARPKG
jgi:tetratricopeptide (TPR) repeat protein